MFKRVLSAIFCAVVIGILVPILYIVLIEVPDSLTTFTLIAGAGITAGAVFGALFPKVSGFFVEMFLDI